MTRTIYQQENGDFSNDAHQAARRSIYPNIFKCDAASISYEDTLLSGDTERGAVYDAELAIDRIVKVTVNDLRAPMKFVVQERFRRPQFASFQDITVTEWNGASDLPSELYKISAGLFVYGYYDKTRDVFIDAIAFHVSELLLGITTKTINYKPGMNKKRQTFLAFSFSELTKAGCIAWRQASSQTLTRAPRYDATPTLQVPLPYTRSAAEPPGWIR